MDIYRFFHPHHNPRLHSTALRQHELSELEQASSELLKAIERAMQRTTRRPIPPIMPQHFTDILRAMKFVVTSLQTLCDAHPGDSIQILRELIQERSELRGWEAWCALVQDQLFTHHSAESENSLKNAGTKSPLGTSSESNQHFPGSHSAPLSVNAS